MIEENKQAICNALLETLKLTRSYDDISSIVFEKDVDGYDDMVTVNFTNGFPKKIYVGLDNGYSMIKDIINKL